MTRPRQRGERGVSESVQWAILLPAIVLTILGIIQVGLWAHGRTVAANAAITAAERATLYQAGQSEARAAATRVAAHGGLIGVAVSFSETSTHVSARVQGHLPTFFDLGQTHVSEQATRPKEQVSEP